MLAVLAERALHRRGGGGKGERAARVTTTQALYVRETFDRGGGGAAHGSNKVFWSVGWRRALSRASAFAFAVEGHFRLSPERKKHRKWIFTPSMLDVRMEEAATTGLFFVPKPPLGLRGQASVVGVGVLLPLLLLYWAE